jgi:hypothetical protein
MTPQIDQIPEGAIGPTPPTIDPRSPSGSRCPWQATIGTSTVSRTLINPHISALLGTLDLPPPALGEWTHDRGDCGKSLPFDDQRSP